MYSFLDPIGARCCGKAKEAEAVKSLIALRIIPVTPHQMLQRQESKDLRALRRELPEWTPPAADPSYLIIDKLLRRVGNNKEHVQKANYFEGRTYHHQLS